jgi:hypothetical protein
VYFEKEIKNVKKLNHIFSIIIIAGLFTSLSLGQTKIAQTGLNFLGVSSDARSSGMGDAVNSLSGFSGALFHNPSSMAEMPTFISTTFSINKWIADINYLAASVIIKPFSGDYGVIGFSLQSVDYGEVEGTINNPFDPVGYMDTGILKPTAMAFGIGYATMLNDKFSVGAQIRFAYQSLGDSYVPVENGTKLIENKVNAIAYDFGTVYKTGIKSLAFGMSVRNFSKEVKYEEEGFQLPLIFAVGISANLFDFIEVGGPEQSLLLSIDSTHPRSHPEQLKIGAEYKFMKMFTVRGGYVTGNSEDNVCFGVGVAYFGVELDYAYTPFGVFDNVQRFTARLSL